MKSRFVLLALFVPLLATGSQTWDAKVTRERKAVLDSISENSMRGNLTFLSSDELEGRGTPSRGLDIAARFIAASFQSAGLEPAGDDGYFQKATIKARGSDDQVPVRNVIGVLRGSDPKLKDTYILVTAHYDHLGMKKSGEGDLIYNGANDDGSGTVSVMELANAMSKYKPRRSIVFMTFYGEERGLVGSTFYGKNPRFPIEKTIADVNLEQIGRTDDLEGPRVNAVSMTGEDYSDVGKIFEAAGKVLGTGVQRHEKYSDPFFFRSDNAALALQGVPAHTICTAFEYPDYHGVADTVDKVDFANMAKVDRLTALAIMMIADAPTEPRWNESNPKASRYVKAWHDRHPG
ncbi:M28 family peptidase [Fimbriimonas ginsengisoli]|uniref:Peptidase M28 n=1 Tax=Fimbriimonas ginsengisoli Gsoil 348 TaxID=661478 RepID=A0A068NWQ7_FIMGI|nr:M28 family peptidase [Fimbriimonas ginsengisoli]AIE87205.1 peptidase M28 [Fimbriimonas ginsengisoli Gsoil 348]